MQRQTPGRTWQARRTALEIDLGLLKQNYKRLAARARGARVLALMKSDAYGHSARDVSRCLDKLPAASGLYGFGVANVEEGIELRRAGVRRPVLVLSGVQDYTLELHRCLATVELTPVIGSLRVLRQLAAVLAKKGGRAAIQLKLNTGMNRLGVDPGEVPACLRLLRANPAIELEGLLSHFAAGEKPRAPQTVAQVRRFRELVAAFRAEGFDPPLVHLANSSGLRSGLFPEGNLARVGLHLYGLDDPALRPVARWTAQVYQVRELAKGEGVGYGPRFRAKKRMRMAVLGVGYGDGYRRAFSNRAHVLLRGRRCPVIGSVSMDLTAVDVSGLPSVSARDEAVLLGKDGREQITAAELAHHSRSISYEILTGITARVPRVFVNG